MAVDTKEMTASAVAVKECSARLLDLLVGWAEYVEATEDEFGDSLTSAELFRLHQDAGELLLLDGDAERMAVAAFLTTRVFPLILRTH